MSLRERDEGGLQWGDECEEMIWGVGEEIESKRKTEGGKAERENERERE